MKRIVVLTVGLCAFVAGQVFLGQADETGATHAQEASLLPRSLDKLYPPQADRPVWFLAMLGMGTSFSGIATDFMEDDFANAEKGYEDFRAQYDKLSQMVPEWASNCPTEPMDALRAALKSRDAAKFVPAFEQASEVCHLCHVQNMTPVQQKYQWGEFSVITLTDPVSRRDLPFRGFMQMLEGDLSGVQVDLAQGQVQQARQHATAMAARYETLVEACAACHESERAYYVDSRILAMVSKLGETLASENPDHETVLGLVQGIGMKSCHECHLVHGPAALSRYGNMSSR